LRASVRITVVSSVRLGMHASFAFQHDTYVRAASVPDRSASARSSARCGSNVPQMKRTDAVPAPYRSSPSIPARTTSGCPARPR
jgi:hypothetical protein